MDRQTVPWGFCVLCLGWPLSSAMNPSVYYLLWGVIYDTVPLVLIVLSKRLRGPYIYVPKRDHILCPKTDRRTDRQRDGRTDGRTDGWTDGRMDGQTHTGKKNH